MATFKARKLKQNKKRIFEYKMDQADWTLQSDTKIPQHVLDEAAERCFRQTGHRPTWQLIEKSCQSAVKSSS